MSRTDIQHLALQLDEIQIVESAGANVLPLDARAQFARGLRDPTSPTLFAEGDPPVLIENSRWPVANLGNISGRNWRSNTLLGAVVETVAGPWGRGISEVLDGGVVFPDAGLS